MGLVAENKNENTIDIELRIAEIDAEFREMIDAASAETVDGFDEVKLQQLISEKNELQAQLGRIAEVRGQQETAQARLEKICALLDGLKNHPMCYDDQTVRQLIECVVVESGEQIKVVFRGGLQVEQPLKKECTDIISEMSLMSMKI